MAAVETTAGEESSRSPDGTCTSSNRVENVGSPEKVQVPCGLEGELQSRRGGFTRCDGPTVFQTLLEMAAWLPGR